MTLEQQGLRSGALAAGATTLTTTARSRWGFLLHIQAAAGS
jgi:hypothetical protein